MLGRILIIKFMFLMQKFLKSEIIFSRTEIYIYQSFLMFYKNPLKKRSRKKYKKRRMIKLDKKIFYGVFVLLIIGLFMISGCSQSAVGRRVVQESGGGSGGGITQTQGQGEPTPGSESYHWMCQCNGGSVVFSCGVNLCYECCGSGNVEHEELVEE